MIFVGNIPRYSRDMNEKRSEERYPLQAHTIINSIDGDVVHSYEATSRNISSKGALLDIASESHEAPTKDQKVHLELTLTIKRLQDMVGRSRMVVLEIDGNVVRSVKNSLAVEFDREYSITPIGAFELLSN